MAVRTWCFDINGLPHRLELQHGTLSGKRLVLLDGRLVASGERFIDFGSTYEIPVDGHTLSISITTNGVAFFYAASLDGEPLGEGEKQAQATRVPPEQHPDQPALPVQPGAARPVLVIILYVLSAPLFIVGAIGLASVVVPFLLTNVETLSDAESWALVQHFLIGVLLASAFLGAGGLLAFLGKNLERK